MTVIRTMRTGGIYALISAIVISGCSIGARLPHENFREVYGGKVGKSIDDPSLLVGNYPKREVGSRTLSNGNLEKGFDMENPWGHCRIYYEVNPQSRIIIAWRFEGSDEACAVPP